MSKFSSTAGLLGSSTAIFAAALMLVGCDQQAQTSASTEASDSVTAVQTAATPPDFSSNGVGWRAEAPGENFVSVPGAAPYLTQHPDYPHIANGEAQRLGVQPQERMADLTNPNLKQWAKDIMQKDNEEILAGKHAYTPRSSCRPAGIPDFILFSNTLRILQTPEKVVMIMSGNHELRRIYLNVPHSENLEPSWYGESVGHYEGDTLVVDTIGQSTNTFIEKYRTPHSEKLHVVERWRMIDGGERMEVHVTIEDPDTLFEPWQVLRHYNRTQTTITEDICAESAIFMAGYGIPETDKADF